MTSRVHIYSYTSRSHARDRHIRTYTCDLWSYNIYGYSCSSCTQYRHRYKTSYIYGIAKRLSLQSRNPDCKMSMASVLLFVACLIPTAILCYNNGCGRTPQMGWNSWNHYHCSVNETVLRSTADTFVANSLPKFGYKYVNVDDCWAASRDKQGNIQPDTKAFPDFQGMIDYIHSKGLLFGLYSDAGTSTCAGRPGSLNYETQDAEMYAKWQVDYLKYDNCHNQDISSQARYPIMQEALNKTGRHIFYSLCEWGQDNPATWAPAVGNSWRTTGDIRDDWVSMIDRADYNNAWYIYSGPYGWNDPDMLEVGNGGMTTTEYETHFSLWCLMKAPLLIGANIENMSSDTLRILTNSEVIAVNQDPLGVQGFKRKSEGTSEVWAGQLSSPFKSYAVLLLNRGQSTANITAYWTDFGLDLFTPASVRDLWLHKDLETMIGTVTATVPSHGVVFYRITPQ